MPGWLLAFRSTSARVYGIPSHGNRTINTVQLVIQSTSVADHLALHVPPPDSGSHGAAIRTGHVDLLRRYVATLLVELLFLIVHLERHRLIDNVTRNIISIAVYNIINGKFFYLALHLVRPRGKIVRLFLVDVLLLVIGGNIRTRWCLARIALLPTALRRSRRLLTTDASWARWITIYRGTLSKRTHFYG